MRGEYGYTLLELLVVLAVMGLITAAIPGMALPGISGVRLSGKVTRVVYQLERAHEMAIQTAKTVVIRSEDLANASGVIQSIGVNSGEIRFFPDGSEAGDPIAVIYAGRERDLAVDSITGRVVLRRAELASH